MSAKQVRIKTTLQDPTRTGGIDVNAKILVVSIALVLCSAATGDVVHLTSGGKLTGAVIEEDDKSIKIKLDSGGVMRLDKNLVKEIEYSAGTDAEKAIANALGLREEAQKAEKQGDWHTAVAKYGKAVRECGLVRKSTGELYAKASALSLELKRELTSIRKKLIEEGDKKLELKDKGEDPVNISPFRPPDTLFLS